MANAVGTMDRGTFVGLGVAAAAAGLGAAVLPSQVAHAEGAAAEPRAWDKEVDFLVVGSGTGAFAALRAANLGAERVLVIEKSSVWGGTSIMSEGGFGFPMSRQAAEAGIEDSADEVVKYYLNASEGRADEAVVRSWIENGNGFIDWTSDQLGWQWHFDTSFPLFGCDYYEPVEGWIPLGRSSVKTLDAEDNSMTALDRWEMLRQKLDEVGVEILMDTAATELVTDAEGAVVGVLAQGPDGPLAIRAEATLLATGGFENNDEMRRKYLPFNILSTCSSTNNTGDGHRMGAAVGAELSNMGCFFGVPSIMTTGDDPEQLLAENRVAHEAVGNDWCIYRNMPGAIVVNRKGRRFANEGSGYDPYVLTFAAYDNFEMRRANIPAFFICDDAYWNTYSLPGHAVQGGANGSFGMGEANEADEAVPEFFVKAETLEELAAKLGIDPDGLAEEVAHFNANAEAGYDPDFHRGESTFDVTSVSLLGGGLREDLANPCLAPLATPPFYGAVYVPGTYSTSGGLTINENAQVMHVNGEPIRGLYACGCCSSGVSGGRYVNGIALASGATMGWVAAGHALGA